MKNLNKGVLITYDINKMASLWEICMEDMD